jgi:two-component system NtrC family sensor kinase
MIDNQDTDLNGQTVNWDESAVILANRRILIVDDTHSIHDDFKKILQLDNSNALEAIEAALWGQGAVETKVTGIEFELDSAYQGLEAVEKVKTACQLNTPFALAFVDVRMPPGWDGIKTIEQLWQIDPHLQVVICTAFSDHSWQDTLVRLKTNDNLLVLKKPFENIEVLQIANAMVNKWNLSAQAKLKMDQMQALIEKRTAKVAQQNQLLQNQISDLQNTRAQLIEAEKLASIGRLAAGIAHEINNPMGFIKSNLTVLDGYVKGLVKLAQANDALFDKVGGDSLAAYTTLKTESDSAFILEDMPKLLSEALSGVGRVINIAADLKVYSHIGQTAMALADINELIERAISISHNETKYKLSISKQLNDLPLIACWQDKLTQVILNLLLNANQAVSEDGEITISTQLKGSNVYIEVKNNGPCIAPDVLDKVFEPFFTTKEVGSGTGLGLYVCHSIISGHGGSITTTSEPGKNTVFSICLPVDNPLFGSSSD